MAVKESSTPNLVGGGTPLLNIEITLDGLAQNKTTNFKNP